MYSLKPTRSTPSVPLRRYNRSQIDQPKSQEPESGACLRGALADDDEYEIRVEAYDPEVLQHHTLIVSEEDIRRCFASHPHLYTLG